MELLMDDDKVTDLKQVFNSHEQGGVMNVQDLGSALRALGACPTEAELKTIVDTAEADDTGGIDFQKFVLLARSKLKDIDPEEQVRQAFRHFDTDGSGTIKAEDLREIMKTMGEVLSNDEVEEMIRDADSEGTGVINYEEFVTIMLST